MNTKLVRTANWLGVLSALAPLPVFAADPIPLPRPPSPFVSPQSDRMISLQVMSLLATNPELADIPVMVDVLNKVVILGGAVPDEATKQQLEAAVRTIPGVKNVQNGCWIRPPEDPLRQMVFNRLEGVPTPVAQDATPRPPSLVIQPADSRLYSSTPLVVRTPLPPPPQLTRPNDRRPGGQVTVNRLTLSTLNRLEDPVGPNGANVVELPMPTAVKPTIPAFSSIPAMNLPTQPLGPDQRIRQIQDANPRWKPLSVSRSGGRVQLSGQGRHPRDIWDFAEAIRYVEGLESILVNER